MASGGDESPPSIALPTSKVDDPGTGIDLNDHGDWPDYSAFHPFTALHTSVVPR